jgi:hypothetical protein
MRSAVFTAPDDAIGPAAPFFKNQTQGTVGDREIVNNRRVKIIYVYKQIIMKSMTGASRLAESCDRRRLAQATGLVTTRENRKTAWRATCGNQPCARRRRRETELTIY